MNTIAMAPAGTVRPAFTLTGLFRREPLFAGTAVMLVVLMAPTLFAMALDARQFNGINIWDKPFKFEVALAVYLGTLALFAGWLPKGMTERRSYRIFSAVVCAAVVAEMLWIGGAAANGTGSHFNRVDPVMGGLYALMGILAVTLTSASLVYGIAFLRDRESRLDPAFRFSLGLGLVLTFAMTLVTAGYMSSGNGHWVGGNPSDAEAIAFMGWARDGGDLRVAHFFASHAMHFIPAAGFIAAATLKPDAARTMVWVAAAAYVLFTAYTFFQALAGHPFLSLL
jgi:hypothetical protein